jgi:putative oxidoreductase
MLRMIVENKLVSLVILAARIYLGVWFLNHVMKGAMYVPGNWVNIGSAVKYAGINFWPQFWGFMAFFTYVTGSVLLISGVSFRLGAAGMAFVLLIAANMHFALGQGLAVAIVTGPGIYVLPEFIKMYRSKNK